MRIRSKQEARLQVGFDDSLSDQSDLKDSGPKIIIIENMFTEKDVDE